MKVTLLGWGLAVLLASGGPAKSVEARLGNGNLLLSDDLRTLFEDGSANIPAYISALSSPNRDVSVNAQRMLQLVGGPDAAEGLSRWYEQNGRGHAIVLGPAGVPLTAWDFARITPLLRGPVEKWGDSVLEYSLALALDPTPRAAALLKEMKDKAARSSQEPIARFLSRVSAELQVPFCSPKNIAVETLSRSTFLSPSEMEGVDPKVIAVSRSGNEALVAETAVFGSSYLVVLKRQPHSCWKFQMILANGVS